MTGETADLWFARSGLLNRTFRATHVLRNDRGDIRRESSVFILVTWVPLAAIGLVEWLTTHRVERFYYDLSIHVRCLVAAPLLFAAEETLYRRCNTVIEQLSTRVDAALLAPIVRHGRTLRGFPYELTLFAIALFGSQLAPHGVDMVKGPIRQILAMTIGTVGYTWYRVVALPLGLFLMLRAFWAWAVWCRLLWSFARLDLRPNAIHPDHVGGLRFISMPANAFAPVLAAASCVLSAAVATQRLLGGAKLTPQAAALPLTVLLVSALALTLGPLLAFAPQLHRARLEGLHEYSRLADTYTRLFRERWMHNAEDDSVLGSSDIQSLADLGGSYQVVRTMRIVPCDLVTALVVVVAILVPMLPLVLIEVPFYEVLKTIVGVLLGRVP